MNTSSGILAIRMLGAHKSLSEVLSAYWPALLIALVVSLAATPIARRLAFKFNILDVPDESVKTHKTPTAYLGGVAVLVGLLAGGIFGGFALYSELESAEQIRMLVGVMAGAIFACGIGLIDDLKDLRPLHKLLGQAVCTLFLYGAGIRPVLGDHLALIGIELSPWVDGVLSFVLILFFVLGSTNSLNLLDGLDGLCAGVTAIITTGFLALSITLATWGNTRGDAVTIVVSLSLVGAVLGFLVFNRHPAKIFLGDAGSVMLGFVIAAMMMLFSVSNPRWMLASIMIFGLPILDTGTALIRRFLNGRPLFVSDRGHIYDQMIDRGIPLRTTVKINYLLSAFYVCIGLGCGMFLRTRYALIVYIAVGAGSFIVLWRKSYFKMKGLRGAIQAETVDRSD